MKRKMLQLIVLTMVVWLVFSGLVFAQTKQFRIVKSFSTPGDGPTGLAWDGTYLWHCDGHNNLIYKMNTSGSVLKTIQYTGQKPVGLAWQSPSYLWVSDFRDDKIYRLSSTDGSINSQCATVHGVVWGIEWDGSYVWTSDLNYAELYKQDLNCNLRQTISAPSSKIHGIAYDGSAFWVVSEVDKIIYKIDKSNGNILERYGYPAPGINGLTWDGNYLWTCSDSTFMIYQLDLNGPPACAINVIQPNGGEPWEASKQYEITWSSNNTSGTVQIEYTVDGGATWQDVIYRTEDDGQHFWTIPDDAEGTQCLIRICDPNTYNCCDESDNFFTITCECSIHITSPNGNEVWDENTNHPIQWTSKCTSGQVRILYSMNSGASWTTIISSTPDDGNYSWTLPEVDTDQTHGKVRVQDANDSDCRDESDQDFTIRNIPPPPTLHVAVPDGGEAWEPGTKHTISWSPESAGAVKIDYSVDGGMNWSLVASTNGTQTCYQWELPPTPTNMARIRVSSLANPMDSDMSDANFTIGTCLVPYIMAGDAVGLTEDTVSVDIMMGGNIDPVTSFGLQLTYNPQQLHYLGVLKGDLTTGWLNVDGSENTTGIITIGGYNTTPIPSTVTGSIARVIFSVSCMDCSACDESRFVVSKLVDDVAGMNICNGVFRFGRACALGDVNMDGQITPGDALCAFQIFLNDGTPVPGSVCDTECAVDAADANCNGTITPQDALFIFQAYLSGSDTMECPANLTKTPARPVALSMEDQIALPGDEITLPVTVNEGKGLSAFGIELSYPPDDLTFLDFERGKVTTNWVALDVKVLQPGLIKIGGFQPGGIAEKGQAELFALRFQVKENAQGDATLKVLNPLDDLSLAEMASSTIKTSVSGLEPNDYGLAKNYPNPFNLSTEIVFRLQQSGQVQLDVIDVTGRTIRTLVHTKMERGLHRTEWNGRDSSGRIASTGIYLCVLRTENRVYVNKMLLIK